LQTFRWPEKKEYESLIERKSKGKRGSWVETFVNTERRHEMRAILLTTKEERKLDMLKTGVAGKRVFLDETKGSNTRKEVTKNSKSDNQAVGNQTGI